MWSRSRKLLRRAALTAMALAAIAGCSAAPAAPAPPAAPRHQAAQSSRPQAAEGRGLVVGVYEPNDPGSYSQVSQYAAATGDWPGMVVYYSNWGQPFETAFARQVSAHGGETLVQVDPRGVSLSAIADGQQDRYLDAYADAVRDLGHPVIISFGQEMNGNWYPWGSGYASPAVYVAAWRHIVDLFRARHVANVKWLWDVNCVYPGSSPLSEWWPGAAYVTWAGLDCYYAYASDTFASLFGPTLAAIRQVTSRPILIAETAVGNTPAREAQITGLFAGTYAEHLLGLVWFDQAQQGGDYHQDWRLEDDPAALVAFRAAAKEYSDGLATTQRPSPGTRSASARPSAPG